MVNSDNEIDDYLKDIRALLSDDEPKPERKPAGAPATEVPAEPTAGEPVPAQDVEESAPVPEQPEADPIPEKQSFEQPAGEEVELDGEEDPEKKKSLLPKVKLPKISVKLPTLGKKPAADGKEEEEKPKKEELPTWAVILHDIVYLLAAVMVIFVFLFRLVVVNGDSMNPTLYNGNTVLLRSSVITKDYDQGDVIVLIAPNYDENIPLIKRVIATEGQTVNINFKTGAVYIDGIKIEENYVAELTNYDPGGFDYPVTVPEGSVFVMGDNRNHSTDSRNGKVGFVSENTVLGKVVQRLVPFGGLNKEKK